MYSIVKGEHCNYVFIITGECFFIITSGKFQHLIPIIFMWWRCSRENKSWRSFHNILITAIVGVTGSSSHLRIDHKVCFWHEGLNRIISFGKITAIYIFFISFETLPYPILIHFPIDMKIYQIRDICKRSSEPLSLNMYSNWKEKWMWNMELLRRAIHCLDVWALMYLWCKFYQLLMFHFQLRNMQAKE